MAKYLLFCLLIQGLVWAENSSTKETSSSVLFTSIGQVTLQTVYGHLLVPLNITALKKAFDHFADLQSAVNHLVASNTDSYNHRQTELNNLRGKLDIIHHLALAKQQDSHFSGLDDLNDFKDKIIANLGSQVDSWKSASGTAKPTPTVVGRRKRQVGSVVEGLIQLAGFTLSLFNRQELTSIQKSLEATQTESNYVASKVGETFLRLDQLIEHTEKVYDAMMVIAKTSQNLHTKQKQAMIVAEVDRLSRIFVSETSMF